MKTKIGAFYRTLLHDQLYHSSSISKVFLSREIFPHNSHQHQTEIQTRQLDSWTVERVVRHCTVWVVEVMGAMMVMVFIILSE